MDICSGCTCYARATASPVLRERMVRGAEPQGGEAAAGLSAASSVLPFMRAARCYLWGHCFCLWRQRCSLRALCFRLCGHGVPCVTELRLCFIPGCVFVHA
eukprot:702750-Rhodomonas_salina.1